MADNFSDIRKLYKDTPREQFGEVYISNMNGKAARRAYVRLNGATMFSVAEKPDVRRPIMPLENLNMRWIDKHTVSFLIPFGQWEIGLTEYSEGNTGDIGGAYSDAVYSNNIVFEVGYSMPKAYFKHKMGWLGPVLYNNFTMDR